MLSYIATFKMADTKDQDSQNDGRISRQSDSQNTMLSVSAKNSKSSDIETQSIQSDDTSFFLNIKQVEFCEFTGLLRQ